MFCSQCGNQNPDGAKFCLNCGTPLSANVPTAPQTVQQVPPMQQPINQVPLSYNAQLPMNQPPQYQGQPMPGQPAPYGAQPAFAAPYYSAPAKKSKTVPIIIGICGALLTAFLIVLFTVIIPNISIKSKINHVWSYQEDGDETIMDFKNNEIRYEGFISIDFPIRWSVSGKTLTVTTYSSDDLSTELSTEKFTVSFSSGGNVMTMTPIDGPVSSVTLTRKD